MNLLGFKGQARVILPTITSCYECSLDMLNKPTAFPICTIANTPRLPEHCIEWASVLEWPRVQGGLIHFSENIIVFFKWLTMPFADKKMDTDDPEHIGWLYKVAAARAAEFKIEGVTWSLTQGVVKNIIPAIASTNAIIAGLCLFPSPHSFLFPYIFLHIYSCLLQRSIQDCYQLCSLPKQLFHAHRNGWCLFIYI